MDIHLYIAINHFQKERKAGSLWTIFIVFWGYFDNFLKSDVPVSLTFPSWHSFAKTSSLRTNPAAAAKSLQLCPTLCDPIRRQPTRLLHPWDSPGKNTRVGCHFLLQCMKVKNESEVAQSCLTLRDPMDCSLPGSSVYGILQARVLEWGAIAFSQGLTLLLLSQFSRVRLCATP